MVDGKASTSINYQPSTINTFAIWLSRQRWLPYKTRRSVLKQLCPAMLRDFPFEADFFENGSGLRFRGNIVNYIDRLVYFCGAHEKYMLRFLRDYAENLRRTGQERITFIDIGANAGNHTLFMAGLADEVHAFEPFPRVRAQLEDNLRLNRIGNVRVHPFGLSHENASLPFYEGPEANLGAASFQASHKEDNRYLGNMQVRRGDEVAQELGIRAGIIKADVEGFEKFVLEGLRETIRRDRPLIIIELSSTTRATLDGEAAFRALFPERYRFCYFSMGKYDSGRYALKPFDYALTPKIEDVIACPEEKLGLLL